jgi:translocation and assembly module TamB
MRTIRRILRILGFLVLLAVALVAGAVAVLTLTDKGRENLAGLISTMASSPDSGVKVIGISGIWSGPLRIDSVVLSDKDGAWLAARGVAVEWSPFALLSSTFDAELIHADRIELARLPKSESESEGGGLPVSLSIDRIDLPEIVLGGALAGEIAQVSAEGSLEAEAGPLAVRTDLKLSRSDGKQGALDAKVDFVPSEDRLVVDVHGSEPAGGIIANFLRLPGAPPVEIAVSGTGPAANWSVEGTFTVDGAVVTKVTGKRQLTDNGNRIEAKGEGAFERFVPETFRALLAGQSTFDFAGTIGDQGAIDVESASLQSAVLTASAKGMIDPAAASDFALQVTAREKPATLSFGEGDGAVTVEVNALTLRAFGAGEAPMADVSASLEKVVTATAELNGVEARLHSDGFDTSSLTGPLTLSVTADSGGSADDTVAGLLAGALKADVTATLSENEVSIETGAVASDTVSATISGDVSLADGSFKLDVKADLLSALLPEAARPALDNRVALTATVVRDTSGAVRVDPLSVVSGAFDAAGSVSYAPDALDVTLTGGFADLAKLSADTAGSIGFEIKATGSPGAPDVSATISSDMLGVAGREITGFTLSASGKADAASPTAKLSVAGNLADEMLAGQAVLKTSDGKRRIEGLSLTLGKNRISGDLTLDEALVPGGTLALSLPDIGPLAALAPDPAEGAVSGTVRFSKADGVPQVAIDAKATSIVRGDLTVTDAEVTALVANYLLTPAISGKVRASSVNVGTTPLRDVDVSLTRDGDWTAFSGGVTVNDIAATAKGRVRLAEGVTTVELASGSAKTHGVIATLANPTTVIVKDGGAAFDRLTLAVSDGSAQITGTAGQTLDLDIQVVALPASVVNAFTPGVEAAGAISGEARISGATESLVIDASASVEKIVTSTAELNGVEAKLHSDGFDIGNLAGPVTLSATAVSGGSENETVAGLLAGALKVDVAATLSETGVHIEKGTVVSGTVNAALSGDVTLADGSLKLGVKADLLAVLLPEAARPALDKKVEVTATVARDASGVVRVDPLSVVSGAFDAAGSVSYAPDALDVTLTGGFADLAKLSADTAGSIGFEIKATGSPETPDIAATISSDRLTTAGREITGFLLAASGKADMANPAANVSIKGNVAGQPLAGEAVLRTAGGQRRIDGLSLTLGNNRISGDLMLDEALVPEGSLSLSLPDIGPLAALALDKAAGSVNGTVRFSKAAGVPQVAIDARAASIVRGDVSVKDAEVAALVANYFLTPTISGKVRALSVNVGTTSVSNVDVVLTRDGDWTGFSGGATVNDIVATAKGRVRLADGVTTVELASGTAKTRGITATLSRATTVVVKAGETVLDKLALTVSGGSVQVSGSAGSALNLDIQVAALPASVANAFAPGLDASGTLSGKARISGAAAKPEIGYTMDWKNGQTAQTRSAGFGAMSVSSTGTFASGVLKFSADVGDGSGLGLKGGGSVETGGGRALSLDFSGQVPFGFLTRRLAAQGLALSGTSNVSLVIRGSTSSPVIGGTITTSGARLIDSRSGLAVDGIAADIAIAKGVATIRRLDGKLSSGGSLSASGTVGIDAAKGFPADLSVKIADARYTDGRIVTTNLSGDLALKGQLVAQPLLSGTINLAKTVITIPERLPGSIAALGVKHRNATAAVREQSAAITPASGGSSGSGLTLDVTVNAPQQIFVRGRGLDAELGGSIRLTGSLSSPRAIGQFTLRRGRLTVLARRLTFTRGTLGFAGSLVPTLDFAAESTVSDATVTVGVTGLANNPKFSFTSSPALPEDEVLARLIFGRSMSNLSPLQIAQLADAAAQLAGGGSSTSLFETLRSKAGIDDLDITTDAQGRAAVSAGKYLNERTYVTIQKGDKAGSGKATIDLDVGRGIKLRGEAAEDGKAKGGIFFEREY